MVSANARSRDSFRSLLGLIYLRRIFLSYTTVMPVSTNSRALARVGSTGDCFAVWCSLVKSSSLVWAFYWLYRKLTEGTVLFLQYLVFLKNGFSQLLLIFLKEKCEEVETNRPCSRCGFAFCIDSQCDSKLQSSSDSRILSESIRALKQTLTGDWVNLGSGKKLRKWT